MKYYGRNVEVRKVRSFYDVYIDGAWKRRLLSEKNATTWAKKHIRKTAPWWRTRLF